MPQAGKDASVPSREGDKASGNRRDAPAGDRPWCGGYNLVLATSGSQGMKGHTPMPALLLPSQPQGTAPLRHCGSSQCLTALKLEDWEVGMGRGTVRVSESEIQGHRPVMPTATLAQSPKQAWRLIYILSLADPPAHSSCQAHGGWGWG